MSYSFCEAGHARGATRYWADGNHGDTRQHGSPNVGAAAMTSSGQQWQQVPFVRLPGADKQEAPDGDAVTGLSYLCVGARHVILD